MKVTKKDERLARSLLWNRLYENGYPQDELDDRVDDAWPGMLELAKNLNQYMNIITDYELSGSTSDEEIKLWSQ